MTDDISEKDKKAWENFLSSNEPLSDKDKKYKNKTFIKSRSIDLHGYTLENANRLIENFITTSYDEGINKLVVVTGKGIHSNNEKNPYVSKDLSILKYSVPDFIENNPDIMKKVIEIKDAEVKDGGSGAFYIFLKKNYKI